MMWKLGSRTLRTRGKWLSGRAGREEEEEEEVKVIRLVGGGWKKGTKGRRDGWNARRDEINWTGSQNCRLLHLVRSVALLALFLPATAAAAPPPPSLFLSLLLLFLLGAPLVLYLISYHPRQLSHTSFEFPNLFIRPGKLFPPNLFIERIIVNLVFPPNLFFPFQAQNRRSLISSLGEVLDYWDCDVRGEMKESSKFWYYEFSSEFYRDW